MVPRVVFSLDKSHKWYATVALKVLVINFAMANMLDMAMLVTPLGHHMSEHAQHH